MTRYRVTSVKYDSSAARNVDKVYTVVERAGEEGATWTDIAATAGVVQSGIHSYLYTLRKGGFIESFDQATPKEEKEASEQAAIDEVFTRRSPKWKCPTCKQWTSGPIGKRCIACKGGESGERSEGDVPEPQPVHTEPPPRAAQLGSQGVPSADGGHRRSKFLERLVGRK